MNQKLIVTAVGTALAAVAGSAFALQPGAFSTAIPQVYMSGATAQNGGIDNVARLVCTDGTLDSYTTAKQVAYVCNVRAGSALDNAATPAGSAIAIHKEYNGGSGNGIAPLINGTTLAFVDVATIAAGTTSSPCTIGTLTAASGSLAAKQNWTCGTLTVNQIPQIGFSDVDPPVLGNASSGAAGTINMYGPNQVTFGVAVTIALRNALQAAQFAGGTSAACYASDAAACTPSLSSAQVQRLFQGSKVNTGATLGIAGDANRIYPLRRGSTSGTQKTAEVFFFNLNIVKPDFTVNAFVGPNASYNSVAASLNYVPGTNPGGCGDATLAPAASMVFAGSSNEEVVNCLNRHQTGSRYAVANLTMEMDQFNAVRASSSSSIDINFPTGFRFVKLNGYLPTVENVVRGNYEYFSEQVITALSTVVPGPGSVVGSVLNAFTIELGNSDNLSIINPTFTKWTDLPAGTQTAGLVGAPRAAACPGTFASLGTTPDADPRNYVSKNPTGSKVSNAVKPAVAICPPRY